MWGLLERTVAVECLGTVAGELKKSKADLQGLLPASEYSALETFFSRTVEAAGTSPTALLSISLTLLGCLSQVKSISTSQQCRFFRTSGRVR